MIDYEHILMSNLTCLFTVYILKPTFTGWSTTLFSDVGWVILWWRDYIVLIFTLHTLIKLAPVFEKKNEAVSVGLTIANGAPLGNMI